MYSYTPQEESAPGPEEVKIKEPRSSRSVFIGLTVLILVILTILFLTMSESEPETDDLYQDTDEIEQGGETTGLINFNGVNPPDWEDYDRAMNNIQTLGANQFIGGQVITNPINSNVVYFAAYSFNTDSSEVSVYRYHMENHNFERLYRGEYESGEFSFLGEGVPAFHVVGIDNRNLIILAKIIGASPGPCTESLLLGTENRNEAMSLLSMSIEDPYAGFEEYTPPNEVLEAARARQTECQSQN